MDFSSNVFTADSLTDFLHHEIPLAAAMGVRVGHLTPRSIKLTAPFTANKNPHGTIFAGSQSTLGILAGWALLHAALRSLKVHGSLVIRESHIRYDRPARSDLWAEAQLDESELLVFLQEAQKKGRARLQITSSLGDNQGQVATQIGIYVVLLENVF